ncbi:MAG: DUF1549 domain-containing protein [Bryobacterales bacterium]|nr:DUF1549 domain-containing protein [Bryobacterales bacterium]
MLYRPGASAGAPRQAGTGTIDQNLFGAMEQAGIRPAEACTDAEFLRRVTLDLTGRIPTRERVEAFLADSRGDKRIRLVDELLASPGWVDKWTLFFGDLFKNSVNFGRQRFPQDRDAMNAWIRASLEANLPYDQMARELITAKGDSSWTDGRLGFLSRAGLTIQLEQDRLDLHTAHISEVFLGISHMDCILCHNGRGHLDDISLWGRRATRRQAWEFSAYFGKTAMGLAGAQPRTGPWYFRDEPAKPGYQIDTVTGDRPPRSGSGVIEPRYLFNENAPPAGDNPRESLAREMTADPQFARAAVNYIWREFFAVGIVEPANQFDPARLDPDNPPPAPWTLQPTNARLLNELGRDFAGAKFDLKSLMRQITTSQAYQLSSAYSGEWRIEYEPFFARKYARRLWAEEIHDAIAQASGIAGTMIAMQSPGGPPAAGPGGNPFGGGPGTDPVAAFLDAFLRGNRVDQPRSGDFNVEQALRLMNNPFVLDRVQVSGERLQQSDAALIDDLFLATLGRRPTEAETSTSLATLQSGDRAAQAAHLQWTLFNKADFIYNY